MTRSILIVDPVSANRAALGRLLKAVHYDVTEAASGAAAVASIRDAPPDLVLAEVALPDIDGPGLCALLRPGPAGHAPPLLFVGSNADADLRLDVLRSGAEDLMARPLDGNGLLARIRSLLRAHDAAVELHRRDADAAGCGDADADGAGYALHPAIAGFAEAPRAFSAPGCVALIVSGDQTAAEAEAAAQGLRAHLRHDVIVIDAATALGLDEGGPVPDVVVLAVDRPGPEDGLPLLSELRSRPGTRHAAILALHGGARCGTAGRALDLGAGDVAGFDTPAPELAHRIGVQMRRKREGDRLRRKDDTLRALATTDPLTGLRNRRWALDQATVLARARSASLAILMIDIDRFKTVNDDHGHAAGDAVLVQIADRLRDTLRPTDILARMGGEEFLVVLPRIDRAGAAAAAARLLVAVSSEPAKVPGHGRLPVTVSIGVAMHAAPAPMREAPSGAEEESADARKGGIGATIDLADRALYAAKRAGRNRVRVAWRPDGPKTGSSGGEPGAQAAPHVNDAEASGAPRRSAQHAAATRPSGPASARQSGKDASGNSGKDDPAGPRTAPTGAGVATASAKPGRTGRAAGPRRQGDPRQIELWPLDRQPAPAHDAATGRWRR